MRRSIQSSRHMASSVANAVNIADLRLMAKRRLPRMVFDYIDGGAEREWTLRENMRAFEDVMFRPRSAVATASCDLEDDGARHCRSICRSSWRPSAAAGCSIRAAKRQRPRQPARPAPSTRLSTLVRLHDGRRQGGDDGQRLVSALSGRRPRCGAGGDRARQGRAATRRWSSRSIRRWPACASAMPATASSNCSRGTCRRVPYLGQMIARPALAAAPTSATAA